MRARAAPHRTALHARVTRGREEQPLCAERPARDSVKKKAYRDSLRATRGIGTDNRDAFSGSTSIPSAQTQLKHALLFSRAAQNRVKPGGEEGSCVGCMHLYKLLSLSRSVKTQQHLHTAFHCNASGHAEAVNQ